MDIKINVIAKKFSTLNKANFSKNYKKFKLKYFTSSKIKKIRKAEEILILLKKEFKYAVFMRFNKYDVWTTILKDKILNRSIANLNFVEKVNIIIQSFLKYEISQDSPFHELF